MRVLLSVIALLGGAAFTSSIRNDELGFSMAVPDGFVDYPEGRARNDFVYYWIEEPPSSEGGRLMLGVMRLGGVIDREPLQRDFPPSMQPMTFRWKGFAIDGGKKMAIQDGKQLVSYWAQIPLRNEAIQIVVAAPEQESGRAVALMTSTLQSLEGESNWLSDEERARRLGESVGRLFVPTIALIGIGVWMRRRKDGGARAA